MLFFQAESKPYEICYIVLISKSGGNKNCVFEWIFAAICLIETKKLMFL